jgi:hypothetical protein
MSDRGQPPRGPPEQPPRGPPRPPRADCGAQIVYEGGTVVVRKVLDRPLCPDCAEFLREVAEG